MGCSSRGVRRPPQSGQGHIASNLKPTIKENKSNAKKRESVV